MMTPISVIIVWNNVVMIVMDGNFVSILVVSVVMMVIMNDILTPIVIHLRDVIFVTPIMCVCVEAEKAK